MYLYIYNECMYACMYVCMYACMHACMHVCIYVYIMNVYIYDPLITFFRPRDHVA